MKHALGALTLSILVSVTGTAAADAAPVAPASSPAALEQGYRAARDAYLQRFARLKDDDDAADNKALADLQARLRAIIGPVAVDGFKGPGKINLETLFPGEGDDQLDGLRFESGDRVLVVTTASLLQSYAAAHKDLPKDSAALARSGSLFQAAFSSDAAVTTYAAVPVKVDDARIQVSASLGLTAQDIGAFVPDQLYVFVASGDRVLLINDQPAHAMPDIPDCKQQWNALDKQYQAALAAYQKSKQQNDKVFDADEKIEERAALVYQQCYARKAPALPAFTGLQRQAQDDVEKGSMFLSHEPGK